MLIKTNPILFKCIQNLEEEKKSFLEMLPTLLGYSSRSIGYAIFIKI
jgi:hypothetical protein